MGKAAAKDDSMGSERGLDIRALKEMTSANLTKVAVDLGVALDDGHFLDVATEKYRYAAVLPVRSTLRAALG